MNKLFVICLMIFISCGKQDELPSLNREYWGSASALQDDKEWNPYIIALRQRSPRDTNNISILLDLYNEYNVYRQGLVIGNIQKRIGVQEVVSCDHQNLDVITSSFLTIIDDGDVLGDHWCIIQDSTNYVEITKVQNDVIEGKYELTFYRDSEKNRPITSSLPDTLTFRNGTFITHIVD